MEEQGSYTAKFMGFEPPAQNYSKLPHSFIDCLPMIDSMAELKVVLYTLRHTWGFSEYGKPKKITTDEFMNGRKRKDGSRMDGGTGLSNNSVIAGLEKAVDHGFILVEVDDTDKARIEKSYSLNMADVQDLHTGPQESHSRSAKVAQRSEKETKERELKEIKDNDFAVVIKAYEANIGPITPMIAAKIGYEFDAYYSEPDGPNWLLWAFEIAVENDARNFRYIQKCLENRKRHGKDWNPKQDKRPGGGKPSTPAPNKTAVAVAEFLASRGITNGQ